MGAAVEGLSRMEPDATLTPRGNRPANHPQPQLSSPSFAFHHHPTRSHHYLYSLLVIVSMRFSQNTTSTIRSLPIHLSPHRPTRSRRCGPCVKRLTLFPPSQTPYTRCLTSFVPLLYIFCMTLRTLSHIFGTSLSAKTPLGTKR